MNFLRHGVRAALVVFFLAALSSRADCPATLEVGPINADGDRLIKATSTSDCGIHTMQVLVDDIWAPPSPCSTEPCVVQFLYNTRCFSNDTVHKAKVVTQCGHRTGQDNACEGDPQGGVVEVPIPADNMPTLSMSYDGPDIQGHGTVTLNWDFKAGHPDGHLKVHLLDGASDNIIFNQTFAPQSGSQSFPFKFTCFKPGHYDLLGEAINCDFGPAPFVASSTHPVDVAPVTTVSGSYDDKNLTITASYQFGNTDSPDFDRHWYAAVDDGPMAPISNLPASCFQVAGTCTFSYPIPCGKGPRTIHLAINGCNRSEIQYNAIQDVLANPDCRRVATHCVPPHTSITDVLEANPVNAGQSCPNVCPLDPIHIGSGDVREEIPLFTLAQEPMSLRFALTYHSYAPPFPALMSQPLGKGWTHSFNRVIRTVSSQRLQLQTSTGDLVFFDKGPATLWVAAAPKSIRDTIELISGQYKLRNPAGAEETYDATTGQWLSTTDRWGNSITGTYDSSGRLSMVTDMVGRQVTLGYRSDGRLGTVTLPSGAVWQFNYAYAGDGPIGSIYEPGETSTPWRTFTYTGGSFYLMTGEYDAAGKLRSSHAYDNDPISPRGIAASSADNRDQATVEYDTPSAGQTRVTRKLDDNTTQIAVYTLDFKGGSFRPTRVDGVCASCGSTTDSQILTFDDRSSVLSRTDAMGHVTQFTYDSYGNVLTRRDAVGASQERLFSFEHSRSTWPTFVTKRIESSATGAFKTTSYDWNANETLLTVTEDGKLNASVESHTTYVSTMSYDTRHRLVSSDGPRTDVADVTTRTFYPDADSVNRRGRLQSMTNAAGLTSSMDDYDVYGSARTMTDPNGVVTTRVTDLRGRVTSTTNQPVAGDSNESAVYTSTSTFDSRDRLAETTSPRGLKTRYVYEDGTNRLTDTIRIDATGKEVERHHLTLNYAGSKVAEEEQLCATPATTCSTWVTKRSDSFVYDDKQRLIEIDHVVPSGSKVIYQYDADGQLSAVQDENHTTPNTHYTYDALHRLLTVSQALAAGQINTSYTYDVADNLTSVTDPNGNVTTYAYDDFRRMQSQSSPVTGVTTYSYDAAGNLLTTTDANGATAARTYDALNRVLTASSSRTGAATENVTYTYDATSASNYGLGRLSTMADPSGSTTYRYERRGLMTSEQKTINGATYTSTYAYDADGNRKTIGYPSGRTVDYTFDFAGRPYSASSGSTIFVSSATYLPFGPMTQMVYGNGTTKTMQYDARYRPTENKLTGPAGTIADYLYQEDAAGNITQIHDAVDPAYNRDFGYDDLNRLVTANSGSSLWGTGSYQYDAMGNMLASTLGAKSSAFAYSGTLPKLTGVTENGASRYVTYDAAGNESTVGTKPYAYSARNELLNADGFTYSYDGRGVRVSTSYPDYALASIVAAPSTLYTNQTAAGTLTLGAPAPAGGAVVVLTTTSTSIALPATVTIPAGETTGTFSITQTASASPGSVTISGKYVFERTTTLTLAAGPAIASVAVAPSSVVGGTGAQATVTLSAAAPPGGAPVSLASTVPTAASVPASVTIAAGATSATVAVTTSPVATSTSADISGTYNGTATGNMTIAAPQLTSLSVSPASVSGGHSATGTVTLDGAAAVNTPVTLTSGNTAAATVPASATVAAGASSQTFPVTTSTSVSTSTNVSLSAAAGNVTKTATLNVTACVPDVAPQPAIPSGDTTWVEDALPAGATLFWGPYGPLHWDTTQSASGSQSLALNYLGSGKTYVGRIEGLSQPIAIGESGVVYVRLNECAVPRELKVTWTTDTLGSKSAYWGQAVIGGEDVNMGALPAAGGWVRLQVPFSQLGLEQTNVTKVAFEYVDGQVWFDHIGKAGVGCVPAAAPQPAIPSGDTTWVEDALPAGGTLFWGPYGPLRWDTTQSASGSQSLALNYLGSGKTYVGRIEGLSQPIAIGESGVVYVRLNECAVPRELKVTWTTDTLGAKSAYWGQAVIGGEDVNMGALPAVGGWVRLQVPFSQLGLEQTNVTKVAFEYVDGHVWFDHIGKAGLGCVPAVAPQPAIPSGDTTWVEDALPVGATLFWGPYGPLRWDTTQSASGSQSLALNYLGSGKTYVGRIEGLSQPVAIGESGVVYVRLDECAVPRELKVTWTTDTLGAKSAYWGQAVIGGENVNMGAMPAAGGWVRLQVPFSQLGLEQTNVTKVAFEYVDGHVWFDHIGKAGLGCVPAAAPQPAIPSGDTTWVEDALPAGATLFWGPYGPLRWDTTQSASGSQSLALNYLGSGKTYVGRIEGLSQPIAIGESGVVYVRLNECAVPRELKVTWTTDTLGAKSAYWGQAVIGGENVNMGAMPAAGGWVRLQVPFSQLGLEQTNVTKVAFEYVDGHVWFDHIGKTNGSAVLTAFSADHASPSAAGTAITWTATGYGSVLPLQYRFERQDNGTWSTVQAYSSSNTYIWTPTSADAGDHAVRVSVRNAGSSADLEDTRTLAMTITGGSGGLLNRARTYWARLHRNRPEPVPPIALSVRLAAVNSDPTIVKHSLYTPELSLMAETAESSSSTPPVAYEYIWFGGQPVAQVDVATSTTHWTFTDHLGTPVLQTNSAGSVDWRAEYEPYGSLVSYRAGTARHQPLRFPGQEFDENASDREYNIFRWYREGWGRYTQIDPPMRSSRFYYVTDKNLYRYARSAPSIFVDRRGLEAETPCVKPVTTGKCAADAIARARWGRCLFEHAHNGILTAEIAGALGKAGVEALCKGAHHGAQELGEETLHITATSKMSESAFDALLEQSLVEDLRICSGGENCQRMSDFFGGCGSPPNSTMNPRTFF